MPLQPAPKLYHWTPERDEIMRAKYNCRRGTAHEIAKSLGFPVGQIRKRATYLRLTRPRGDHKPWTPADDATLEALLGVNTVDTIASKMGRSASSIRQRAWHLQMSTELREGYTINSLAECFGAHQHAVRRWMRDGKLKGKQLGDRWLFTDSDILEFIRKCPNEFKLSRVDQTWFMDLMLHPREL
jgi:hypothetical protein